MANICSIIGRRELCEGWDLSTAEKVAHLSHYTSGSQNKSTKARLLILVFSSSFLKQNNIFLFRCMTFYFGNERHFPSSDTNNRMCTAVQALLPIESQGS